MLVQQDLTKISIKIMSMLEKMLFVLITKDCVTIILYIVIYFLTKMIPMVLYRGFKIHTLED